MVTPTKATNWNAFYIDSTGALVSEHSGARIAPPAGSVLWQDAPFEGAMDPGGSYRIFDDFIYQASATASSTNLWTALTDGGTGTPAYQTTVGGGWFNTVTAAADNDYSAYSSVNKVVDLTAGKRCTFEARYKVSEATVLESTYWFGISDTLTTGGFQANEGGPLASFDGILLYKTPETAMTINAVVSNGATQSIRSAFATAITNTTHRIGFHYDGVDKIYPYFHNGTVWTEGAFLQTSLTSFDAAYIVWGIKAGPSAAAETLQLDYIKCVVER